MIFKLILKNFLLLSGGIFTLVIIGVIVKWIFNNFVDFMAGLIFEEFRFLRLLLCLGLFFLLIFAVALFIAVIEVYFV